MNQSLYTIGHSNRAIHSFIAMLKTFDVGVLTDIRTVPGSKYNPQFSQDALRAALEAAGMRYRHMKDLGGLRRARPDSPNTGFREGGFRGYADYMQTDVFQAALRELVKSSQAARTAIMCAEADPAHCHRSLVADALLVQGVPVVDILSIGKAAPHKLNELTEVKNGRIFYPAPKGPMDDLFANL